MLEVRPDLYLSVRIYSVRHAPDKIFIFYIRFHRPVNRRTHTTRQVVPLVCFDDCDNSSGSLRRATVIDGGLGESSHHAFDKAVFWRVSRRSCLGSLCSTACGLKSQLCRPG